MKTGSSPKYKQTEFKFTFGPFLQDQGAELWPPQKMIEIADLYEDAAHQLRVISEILYHKKRPCPFAPKPLLKLLPPRKLALN